MPECVDISVQNDPNTRDRAAPRQEIHNTHRRTDDNTEYDGTNVQLLVDRQHCRNRHEKGCGERAVKMGNRCNAGGRNRDQNDVRPGMFHEEINQRIKEADLRHD